MPKVKLQPRSLLIAALMAVLQPLAGSAAARSLDIYYIDTEGGQASLFVAPQGQTVLIDTGFPGARDAQRIVEAAHAAGVVKIDFLLITHYHRDHVGGYEELAKLIPIDHLVDHGPTVQPEQADSSKQAYDLAIEDRPHLVAKPADKLPILDIDWTIVSSAGKTLSHSMAGAPNAGKKNDFCAGYEPKDITVDLENAQSVGSVIRYGKFRTVDLADLLWNLEARLACPVNLLGTVDVLLTTHHGSNLSGVPALIYALQPRVVVMNNGSAQRRTARNVSDARSIPQTARPVAAALVRERPARTQCPGCVHRKHRAARRLERSQSFARLLDQGIGASERRVHGEQFPERIFEDLPAIKNHRLFRPVVSINYRRTTLELDVENHAVGSRRTVAASVVVIVGRRVWSRR